MTLLRNLFALSLLFTCQCGSGDGVSKPAPTTNEVQQAAGPLLWKRGDALVNDLQNMLALSAPELCVELGTRACAEVHRVPLGQSDPFVTGLLEPVTRPLATTVFATERLVLSACSQRVKKDASDAKGSPFTSLGKLDQAMPAAGPAQEQLVSSLASALYHVLLARDPNEAERTTLAKLAVDDAGNLVDRGTFAKLACFAVATTSEFLLY